MKRVTLLVMILLVLMGVLISVGKQQSRIVLGSDVQFSELESQTQPAPDARTKTGELKVPVLMYHHIDPNPKPGDRISSILYLTAAQLNQQLSYLSDNGYHTVSLKQLGDALDGKGTLPARPVVLTFDDGYRSFYENAFPLLQKYNMKATEFVITGYVGAQAYLTWDEILQMDSSGLVEFGAHTRFHLGLAYVTSQRARDEIFGSKKDLESHLNKPIYWFAYPYGSYSNLAIDLVKQAGYQGAVSTVFGSIQSKGREFLAPRIMVSGRRSFQDFVYNLR